MTTRNENRGNNSIDYTEDFKELVDAISDLRKAIAAFRTDYNKRKAELLDEIKRLRTQNTGY